MSDERKLLELAAKAAGMEVLGKTWGSKDGWFFCVQHGISGMHFRKEGIPHYHSKVWRPLDDDGDALRLALFLGLVIDMRCRNGGMRANNEITYWINEEDITGRSVIFGAHKPGEADAACRRAIVHAAAEIGKEMTD